jgi:hypothetical protein
MDDEPILPAVIETGPAEVAPRRGPPLTRSMGRTADGTEVEIEHHPEAAEL